MMDINANFDGWIFFLNTFFIIYTIYFLCTVSDTLYTYVYMYSFLNIVFLECLIYMPQFRIVSDTYLIYVQIK